MLADASLKKVGTGLPALEVIGFVRLAEVILLLAYGLLRGNLTVLRPRDPTRQLLRSCLDLINNFWVVIAVRRLPLALFYILIFLAPTVTTLLAAVLLREALEPRKGLAILVGFAGVKVAVNPWNSARPGGWTGYVACPICVACFSTNIVWSRVLTQTEAPESLTFCSGALMAVAGFAGMIWKAGLLTAKLALVLAAAGLLSVLGALCFFVALKHATAATVSQYHSSQLFTGTLVAFFRWHERITLAMLFGAALIIAAGFYTAAASDPVSPELTSLEP